MGQYVGRSYESAVDRSPLQGVEGGFPLVALDVAPDGAFRYVQKVRRLLDGKPFP